MILTTPSFFIFLEKNALHTRLILQFFIQGVEAQGIALSSLIGWVTEQNAAVPLLQTEKEQAVTPRFCTLKQQS